MEEKNKVYSFWNGKNIDGKSYVGYPELIKEVNRNADNNLIEYEVGIDTVSADDLQKNFDYDQM